MKKRAIKLITYYLHNVKNNDITIMKKILLLFGLLIFEIKLKAGIEEKLREMSNCSCAVSVDSRSFFAKLDESGSFVI